MSVIIANSFKGLLRNQIINQPKWWFHSIEEVIDAPFEYPLLVASNGPTYYSIRKMSKYDPKFKVLFDRLKTITFQDIFGLEIGHNFYNRKCAGFATSYNLEIQKIMSGSEVVIDEIRYDHVLDVRLIRKDFQLSDKMVLL